MLMFHLFTAAKLGRRSRKMREMINEATRTIEDSQTAQALHGLLSLKSDSGPSNFPALLKAVGQHVSPGQVPSAAAGSSGEVSHTVEVSTVPPAATTVVVSATETVQPSFEMANLRSPPATTGSQALTNTTQQTTYKPKAGSVMDLLMQMQSQAQQAQSTGQSNTAIQQSESLGTVTGNTGMSTPKKAVIYSHSNYPNTYYIKNSFTPKCTDAIVARELSSHATGNSSACADSSATVAHK